MPMQHWMSMADPIHGMIRLKRHDENHQLILDIMNSQAFQRLRRIRQMGMAEFVFPGATHNRFVHSIGSAWLMIKAIEHLKDIDEARAILKSNYPGTNISIERLLLVSILVHDIGHTPLSHTLEDVLDLKSQGLLHDTYWNKLLLEHDEELLRLWKKYNPEIPYAVSEFMGGEPGIDRHFMADLVSSQLDMDRMDYLLRDSHYLGVQYGRIEVERIITNLMIGETPAGKTAVAIREEAIPAVEHYLFGRYEAYKMALHSLDKASETLLKMTLDRFRWVKEHGIDPGHPADLLYQFIVDGRSLLAKDYLMLDDCYLWDKVNLWARYSQDALLKELANRLLSHDLLKYVEFNSCLEDSADTVLQPIREEMARYYESRGLSFEFGFYQMLVVPKSMYQRSGHKPPIWVYRRNGRLMDFADASLLPLQQEIMQGKRCLLFTWDRESRSYLKKLLQKHFGPNSLDVLSQVTEF